MSEIVIATWFHADFEGIEGRYSQTLGNSKSSAHHRIYLDCVLLFFATLKRHNRQETKKFFINEYGRQKLDKDFVTILEKWDVEIVSIPNTHDSLQNPTKMWLNQFFVLDIIKYQSELKQDFHLFDSDVLVVKNSQISWGENTELKLMVISENQEEIINGLSVAGLSDLWKHFNPEKVTGYIPYYGGEYIGIKSEAIHKFSSILEKYYSLNLVLNTSRLPSAMEEAHLISIASRDFKVDSSGGEMINRIWTQPWTFRHIPKNVNDLTFLHLPAEKKTGLAKLSNLAINFDSWFWKTSDNEWASKVLRIVGVSSYTSKKLLSDLFALRKGIIRHIWNRFHS